MVSRWITIKINPLCGEIGIGIIDIGALKKISPSTIAFTAIAVFCLAVIALSTLDCFHIHQGLSGSLSSLQPTGTKVNKEAGYIDFMFNAVGQIVYDQDAHELLAANPDINIFDLDLGFVFHPEELGFVDPRDMQKAFGVDITNRINIDTNTKIQNINIDNNKAGGSSSIDQSLKGNKFTSIGKQKHTEPLFKVSGERIRRALRLREEQMPLPSSPTK